MAAITTLAISLASTVSVAPISRGLARIIYPLSRLDFEGRNLSILDGDYNNWGEEDRFFDPNVSIRVSVKNYHDLSTLSKVSKAAIMLLSGLFLGATAGFTMNALAALILNAAFVPSTAIVVALSSIGAAWVSSLPDPTIGYPAPIYRQLIA